MTKQERQQRATEEIEQSVLGAMMLDEAAFDQVAATLREEHFAGNLHRRVFRAISALTTMNRRADVLTVRERMEGDGYGTPDLFPYLNSLVQNTPGSRRVATYAGMIVSRWRLRAAAWIGAELRDAALNTAGLTATDIIGEAQAKLEGLMEEASDSAQLVGNFLGPVIERIDTTYHSGPDTPVGLSTGLTDLDDKLNGGAKGGQLIIVAGRPGMGKTALALGLAEEGAKKDPFLFFTQEMKGEELGQRSLSRNARLPLEKIIDSRKFEDADWPLLTHGVQLIADMRLVVDERPSVSVAEVAARARQVRRQYGGLSGIAIDYLGLMKRGNEPTTSEQIGAITRALKALAKELDVPVYLLAQLSRKVEERPKKRPLLSDLRDSGEIEQDADVILLLYRDEYYNPDSPERGMMEIDVAKQRNGATGIVRAVFIGEQTRCVDVARDYRPPVHDEPKRMRGFD